MRYLMRGFAQLNGHEAMHVDRDHSHSQPGCTQKDRVSSPWLAECESESKSLLWERLSPPG
jgi:hypothetical protein